MPPKPSKSSDADQLAQRGLALHRQGRYDEAKALYEAVVRRHPKHWDALHLLGLIHMHQGQLKTALAMIGQSIAINPVFPPSRTNYGIVLHQLGRSEEAVASYDKAIALSPERAAPHYNRGNALAALNRPDEALESYDRALALNPDRNIHYNRGNALAALNRLDEALESQNQAIALQPAFTEGPGVRGGSPEPPRSGEAAASGQAAAWRPEFADAYWNAALAHLLQGDFPRGLPLFEWRKRLAEPHGNAQFVQPLWLGREDIAGKRILVHHEQGLGDTLQFSRFIAPLNARGAQVLFAPQPALNGLMKTLDASFTLVDPAGADGFDFHCPLMSLPLALGVRLDTLPHHTPYLSADPQRTEQWRARIGPDGFKIGICWQGSTLKVDVGRSFDVAQFAGVSQLAGVRLISLHKGAGEAQLAHLPPDLRIETLGSDFDAGPDAFLDSAAVMQQCDLVITSDTAIAHLAGALGRPTWVALKFNPDWRWMLGRQDSPWYPGMRLFRQQTRGDWQGVFDEIEHALAERLDAAPTGPSR